jgi:hypothetical protein
MQPARWSIKNQRADEPIPIPDIHRGIGIGVRLVSALCADIGSLLIAPHRWQVWLVWLVYCGRTESAATPAAKAL